MISRLREEMQATGGNWMGGPAQHPEHDRIGGHRVDRGATWQLHPVGGYHTGEHLGSGCVHRLALIIDVFTALMLPIDGQAVQARSTSSTTADSFETPPRPQKDRTRRFVSEVRQAAAPRNEVTNLFFEDCQPSAILRISAFIRDLRNLCVPDRQAPVSATCSAFHRLADRLLLVPVTVSAAIASSDRPTTASLQHARRPDGWPIPMRRRWKSLLPRAVADITHAICARPCPPPVQAHHARPDRSSRVATSNFRQDAVEIAQCSDRAAECRGS